MCDVPVTVTMPMATAEQPDGSDDMPTRCLQLTLTDVVEHVETQVFATPDDATDEAIGARNSVGIELEWLTGYRSPRQRLTIEQAEAVVAQLGSLPGGSTLTI